VRAMRTGWLLIVSASLGLAGSVFAQPTPPAGPSTPSKPAEATAVGQLRAGPATIALHWSKYDYPKSVPEGAPYHIIERGDTLWDLAKRYLGNAYLWPQIWHENGYVKDAHWIYPGDPLVFPKLQVVAGQAGQEISEGGPGAPFDETGGLMPTEEGAAPGAARRAGTALVPVVSEIQAQCSPYIPNGSEDDGLRVIGSEQGPARLSMATADILYFNRGEDAGLKPGDVFTIHHKADGVQHPKNGGSLGTKIQTVGWARVILTQPNSATAVVEQACLEIRAGDYLKPFQKIAVPLVAQSKPSDRLTPPSGKAQGWIVDLEDRNDIAGAGNFAIIDLGSKDGLAPGTPLVVYRIMYPEVPTSRNVVGDMVVLTVQDRTATAMITASNTGLVEGDHVEVR
jgi:hypothetical protein